MVILESKGYDILYDYLLRKKSHEAFLALSGYVSKAKQNLLFTPAVVALIQKMLSSIEVATLNGFGENLLFVVWEENIH